jgi:hypothetical protein
MLNVVMLKEVIVECRVFLISMLSVILLIVIMLSVVGPLDWVKTPTITKAQSR